MITAETLAREYQRKVHEVKADERLSWEKKLLTISRLRREYDRKIREAESKGAA
jgi:hypothetical protein